MGLDYLKKMHSRGDTTLPSDPISVFLYPWSSSEDSAVASDGVVTKAIEDALDQLYDYGAIDYYAIYRWHHEDAATNYPEWGDIDDCSYSAIDENFKSFLGESIDTSDNCGTVPDNGTGDNYYSDYTGVHQLIHGGYSGCDETAGGYAPNGAGAEAIGCTAFQEGRTAWSPVCSDESLTEAAAIQETVHMLEHPDYDQTNTCDNDPRDHSLGTLNYYPDFNYTVCTPMLAYHWDDFDDYNENPDCPCPVDRETSADSHTRDLTSCTKKSVYDTVQNLDSIC